MNPIVIVGGGIGGLAAALALARANFSAHVVEQAREFGEVGAGIQLGPNIFRALDWLGLQDRVLNDAWQPGALDMRDALTGAQITRMPLGEAFLARFKNPYAVIHRADLHGALLEAARADPRVTLEAGRRVEDFRAHAGGVEAVLDDGRVLKAPALIGADGLWSKIRARVLNDGPPIVSGHIAYRAVLRRDQVPADLWHPDVVLWAGPRTHLVQYPLRRGELFNLVAVFHSDRYVEGWNAAGDIGELNKRFAGQRPEVLRLLARIETWRMWVLCDRVPVANWSSGPVTLLGDAAHPMLQYLAQGAAMAVEDAVQLAREAAATPDDLPAAFVRYQQARYLRTGRVQLTARFYGDVYHAAGVAAELRAQMLAGRTPESAYEGMDWLYGA